MIIIYLELGNETLWGLHSCCFCVALLAIGLIRCQPVMIVGASQFPVLWAQFLPSYSIDTTSYLLSLPISWTLDLASLAHRERLFHVCVFRCFDILSLSLSNLQFHIWFIFGVCGVSKCFSRIEHHHSPKSWRNYSCGCQAAFPEWNGTPLSTPHHLMVICLDLQYLIVCCSPPSVHPLRLWSV